MCLYVRTLTDEEQAQVATMARSYDAVTARRARIVQLSSQRRRVSAIAETVGVSTRWVREVIHWVNAQGLARIPRGKSPGRPRTCQAAEREALIELLHERPDAHGHARAQWTAAELAVTAVAQGIVDTISQDTVRREMRRARRSWQRAKRWSTSPDPQYAAKRGGSSAG